MSKENDDEELYVKNDHLSTTNIKNGTEATEELSLLNSIVDAVMRGDMNQVVTLALSHRSSDQKVKNMVDQALSSAISNKAKLSSQKQEVDINADSDLFSENNLKSLEDISVIETSISKSPSLINHQCSDSTAPSNVIYSKETQSNSSERNNSGNNTILYSQSGYGANNTDLDSHPDDSLTCGLSQYQVTNSLQNVETINNLNISTQSVHVQLPGIGNFLLQIPPNFKPGDPITLPLNLPLSSVSQTSSPISINMNTGQLMSNQLLSLYNPSSNVNVITAGKKMRAIAPKPSKPAYRQPLIAPKTNSPGSLTLNHEVLNINSIPLPAPSGPGRRKGKKSSRKRGAPAKFHKNSSYASSTHSIDSQDASQFNETNNSIKQNCNNFVDTSTTYQGNYFINSDSADYLNQSSNVTVSQSFQEINSTLLDNSDSGEKDLLSLAWEISNAELGTAEEFATTYNLYDTNNLESESFVSNEILDQFLQNIQKDDMSSELARCSTTDQGNIDSRVIYASSFTTLPPCSTVLPSVTTSTYLNKYSNNSTNTELPPCIEIAEVVNLNTEYMLSELEKENSFNKFVTQYGTDHQAELIRCDSSSVIPVLVSSSSQDSNDFTININNNDNDGDKDINKVESVLRTDLSIEESEKEVDQNMKEFNELSEIAKQIEISCNSSNQNNIDFGIESKIYTICDGVDNLNNKVDCFSNIIDANALPENDFHKNITNPSISFCTIPNNSLELIYSSTENSSLVDEKTQCLMSLNFNAKQSGEGGACDTTSFYITDSCLKSKTLDDFGLFEFCMDGEISLNMKRLNSDSSDDNKYIEPPILEDISDATPIQSDESEDDEDIDEFAFKFSKLNSVDVKSDVKQKNYQSIFSEKLCFSELRKNLPNLDDIKSDRDFSQRNISNCWYIGIKEINMVDKFLDPGSSANDQLIDVGNNLSEIKYLKEKNDFVRSDVEQKDGHRIAKKLYSAIDNVDLDIEERNDNSCEEMEEDSVEHNGNSIDYYNEEIIGKIYEIQEESKKYKSKGQFLTIDKMVKRSKSDNIRQRQRRLRKPPKKLAIYQSIDFVDKDSVPGHINEMINNKNKIEIVNNNLSTNTDFRRCTRSKGMILKSFDVFYEAISRHNKISLNSKEKPSTNTNSNFQENEIPKSPVTLPLSEDKSKEINNINANDVSNEKSILCKNVAEIPSNINERKVSDCHSTINLTNESDQSIIDLKSDEKSCNMVIRKYNLRKNILPIEREENQLKLIYSKLFTDKKVKSDKNRIRSHRKIKKTCEEKLISFNEIINIPSLMTENFDLEESLDFDFSFPKSHCIVTESEKDELRNSYVDMKLTWKPIIVQNRSDLENISFDQNTIRKHFPVRKISKRLRMFSGLEVVNVLHKNLMYGSLVDINLNEIPIRFQCGTQFAEVYVSPDYHIFESKCNLLVPKSYSLIINNHDNVINKDDLPISDTEDAESLDAPLVIVEIDDVVHSPVQPKPIFYDFESSKEVQVCDENNAINLKTVISLDNDDKNSLFNEKIMENQLSVKNDLLKSNNKLMELKSRNNEISGLDTLLNSDKELINEKSMDQIENEENSTENNISPNNNFNNPNNNNNEIKIINFDNQSINSSSMEKIDLLKSVPEVIQNRSLEAETTNQDLLNLKNNEMIDSSEKIVAEKSKLTDMPKTYSLRPNCRQCVYFNSYDNSAKQFESHITKRPMRNRSTKKSKKKKKNVSLITPSPLYDDDVLINNINLRTPICAIEKLSHHDLIANFCTSSSLNINDINYSSPKLKPEYSGNKKTVDIKSSNIKSSLTGRNLNVNIFRKIKNKLLKKQKRKRKVDKYKKLKKSIWRKTRSRLLNFKPKFKRKSSVKCLKDQLLNNNNNLSVKLGKEYWNAKKDVIVPNNDIDYKNKKLESYNLIKDCSSTNQFTSYLESNNVETFSRNYGQFSLKIKVQKKKDHENHLLGTTETKNEFKRHKKNSRRRKKLRHFLTSIIGSDDKLSGGSDQMGIFSDNVKETTIGIDKKRKNRKRKYCSNDDRINSCYTISNKTNSGNQQFSVINEEDQYQKPIKIKLFKSTNDDLRKSEVVNGDGGNSCSPHSERIVFSLHKLESSNKTQNILQVHQEVLTSKPCRQAANLAKKKIFSTAKEDRRSQNATLASIWNSRKQNNGIVKPTSDILTIYQNDRNKRPRGRPPKFISEKHASSSGTLKLKIKLTKQSENFCNNDNGSSSGDNSGRTSTNDSSIFNSAVAGINGPSDSLSLESNHFINVITEQFDQNIEYLEAKEAKVYFDPNQVDIERIKNSYYSSKKIHTDSLNVESHQRSFENSKIDFSNSNNVSNKKSEIVSNKSNFSQYGDLNCAEQNDLYGNVLSKENCNSSKISHLLKENVNMNLSDNCYGKINREPQNLSKTNQHQHTMFPYENHLSSIGGKNTFDLWHSSKAANTNNNNSADSLMSCRTNNGLWFSSDHRNIRDPSFQNSNGVVYNSFMSSPVKDSKNCISQTQNPSFIVCEHETSDPKLLQQQSPSKRSGSSEGDRKSGSNSFSINESHNQLSPRYVRSGGLASSSSQLNIHPWSDETNHNASLNHTAAAWMTYAQQQAAAYMDPQMKAYYNLALSQSMLNNPYCGSYGNPVANSENFYSSLHSQYLNNSKDANQKINIPNGGNVRNQTDPMGSFMDVAQMSPWEHFYSAAAMAGYHNPSQGTMDDYAGRAGNMLHAHHILANGYPVSMLGRDHFTLDNNKPPMAHQNQSGSSSPTKLTATTGSTQVSSSQEEYSHVQMPYSHFNGTSVGFF